MRREDWLWLLIKAAGIWLLVSAVEVMADPAWSWFQQDRHDLSGRDQFLRVIVPLAAGLALLLGDSSKWLPIAPAARAPTDGTPAADAEPGAAPDRAPAPLSRADYLWIGLKVVGAFHAVTMIVLVSQLLMYGLSEFGWPALLVLVFPAVGLALSLWLLFGERVWLAACRGEAPLPVAGLARTARSAGAASRQVLVVVLVFAALFGIPIGLLWWAAGTPD